MGKHTPGPWSTGRSGGILGPGGITVAETVFDENTAPGQFSDETFDANARLIAAAPEMLEELRSAAAALDFAADDLESLERPKAAIACRTRADRVRKVIAKAEGRSNG